MDTKTLQILLRQIQEKPSSIQDVDPSLFSCPNFMLEALRIEPRLILYASLELCLDEDFKRQALAIDPHIEKYFKTKKKLSQTHDF